MNAASITVGAAFVAGLAASVHCIAMCGGVAGALMLRARSTGSSARLHAVAYNLARIVSYGIAGAIAGAIGQGVVTAIDMAAIEPLLRIFAAALMLAAAARMLLGWRLLEPLEATGAALVRHLAPAASPPLRARSGLGGSIAMGLAWGCMPCGMSYSMLLLAATTASAALGASVMLAFGTGTLLAMITTTLAMGGAARRRTTPAGTRRAAGLLLVGFAIWTVGSAAWHAIGHTSPHSSDGSGLETAHHH